MAQNKNRPVSLYSINLSLDTIGKVLSRELALSTPVGRGKEPDADGSFDKGDGAFVTAFIATRNVAGTEMPIVTASGDVKINLRVQVKREDTPPPPPSAPPVPDIDAE